MKKWIPIQLKRSLANPFAWIVAVLALAAFLLVNSIVLHEPQTTAFGLYTEGGMCAHHMEEFFSNDRDATCPCVLYRTDNAVKRARGFAQCFQRVHRNTGQSRAVSQTFCGSHADTDPCKASGACHRGYGVQVSDLLPGRVQGCFHHRHQIGGMSIPVLDGKLTVNSSFVHDRRAANRSGCIDYKYPHSVNLRPE